MVLSKQESKRRVGRNSPSSTMLRWRLIHGWRILCSRVDYSAGRRDRRDAVSGPLFINVENSVLATTASTRLAAFNLISLPLLFLAALLYLAGLQFDAIDATLLLLSSWWRRCITCFRRRWWHCCASQRCLWLRLGAL